MPYALQLLHKRNTVKLAYSRFSDLPPSVVPDILPTIGSPKQWGYRTKITPHFDAVPKTVKAQMAAAAAAAQAGEEEEGMNGGGDVDVDVDIPEAVKNWECRIGFERKGRPGVLDIEVSPRLGSPVSLIPLTRLGMPNSHASDQHQNDRRA